MKNNNLVKKEVQTKQLKENSYISCLAMFVTKGTKISKYTWLHLNRCQMLCLW